MPDETFVFLDFDDTLSDFGAFGAQYVEELATLLSTDFGGDPAAWAAAIRPNLDAGVRRYEETFTGNPLAGYTAWLPQERRRIVEAIFSDLGVALPGKEEPEALAARYQFDALTACNAAFPGAEEALRVLFEQGVRTQMASSQDSEFLLAALIGAGIESYTESKFGPDLVDCAKEGPEFYQRIFAASRISPSQAIVVDDQAMCLDWAEETGARVIQARLQPHSPEPEFPVVLTNLADLPKLVLR